MSLLLSVYNFSPFLKNIFKMKKVINAHSFLKKCNGGPDSLIQTS